jgi:hypothetical protein
MIRTTNGAQIALVSSLWVRTSRCRRWPRQKHDRWRCHQLAWELGEIVASAEPDLFVPADADRFCEYCGFPFRGKDRSQRYCYEYPKSEDHGACGKRLRDAQTKVGLRRRLGITQEADPCTRRTNEDAIAHAWVRQHYPDVDLERWRPAR